MKNTLGAWSVAGMLAFAGCATGTSGGPGTPDSGRQQPLVGRADDTFQLTRGEMVLRQGETKSVSILIKRARNFDEDVSLKFSELPKGLSIDNLTPEIKHGDSEARFALTASDDAALGDFSLMVTGHPTNGSDATNKLDITINRK
jgi:hypothetical protein